MTRVKDPQKEGEKGKEVERKESERGRGGKDQRGFRDVVVGTGRNRTVNSRSTVIRFVMFIDYKK